jgi:hypothetical protein
MLSVVLVRTAPLYERVRHIVPSIDEPPDALSPP